MLTLPYQALCHCLDCRKISGSTYSTNLIVPGEGFEVVQGTPKEISKTADDSKNAITSYFCPDCGSTLFRKGATFGDAVIVKAGTLDDHSSLESHKPELELYAGHRPSWVGKVGSSAQKKGMPDSEDHEVSTTDKIKAKLGA